MADCSPMSKCTVGERYEAQVPDTLDLASRMALAINALTNVWNPDEKWSLAFVVDFSRKPAVLYTNHITDAYLNIPAKFQEALALCRLGSGSTQSLEVDAGVADAQASFVADDGLSYCPTDTLTEMPGDRPFSEIWGEGRQLVALSTLAQVDNDPRWLELAKRKVDGLLALTREKEGFRFFWRGRFRPGEVPPADADEPFGPVDGGCLVSKSSFRMRVNYSVGSTAHGAGLLYRITGYEPALELCRGLARWALARNFMHEDGHWNIHHFHHSLYALMGVCEYGIAAGDREVLERVDACYRWAREMGDPLIGYYGECMPGSECYLGREGNTVEICEVADMVWLALCLTRAGIGNYWDDVDRWTRNVYAEGQLVDPTFVDRIPKSYLTTEAATPSGSWGRFRQDTNNMAERSVGSFWGWMRANDGLEIMQTPDGTKLKPRGIMHCCTANGARTLYPVWDSTVTQARDTVTVNLLLNRASPWLDVNSYLPVEGKVTLSIKDAPRVAVRMPEWCDPATVCVQVGDQCRRPVVEGPFVKLAFLQPGDQVTMAFPVPERTIHRVIGEIPYKLAMKGSNVVSIDPPGTAYPLYQDQPTGRPKRKTRFVPSTRDIIW